MDNKKQKLNKIKGFLNGTQDVVNLTASVFNEVKSIVKRNIEIPEESIIVRKGNDWIIYPLKRLLKEFPDFKGDKGYTPIKGKDYFTEQEAKDFLDKATPIKGKHYKDGIDAYTPQKGVDYFTEEEVKQFLNKVTPIKGKHYRDGKDGKDAIVDNNLIIGKILEDLMPELNNKEKKLLKTLEQKLIQMVQRLQVHGGGISREEVLQMIAGSSIGEKRDDLSPQCDGVNKVFTLTENYKTGTLLLLTGSFPIIYRPIIDFIESGAKEITLTAEVPAPESGQTLVVKYEKQN